MRETGNNPIWLTALDIVCLAFFAAFLMLIFCPIHQVEEFLDPLFAVINPFTTGVYSMGCGLLITLMNARGKTGLILGALMSVSYLIMTAISLVALMGASSISDLMMYGPNVIIVLAGIFILIQRGKK